MRCSVATALATFALLATFARGAAAAPAVAATDAFRVAAPRAPWTRAADLDPPGRLTWTITDPRVTTAQLRAEFVGVRAATPESAFAELLGRERADIAARSAQVSQLERGSFEPDSATTGRLAWRGLHLHVRVGDKSGEIWRWVALSPDFPRRRRAFLVALDEQTLAAARFVPHEADARALFGSLTPTGNGLAGGLLDAYLDARVSTFAARVDSTTRLCWRAQEDDPGRGFVGVARGLAGDGDFFQATTSVPKDSVVDAASNEYGVGFDRNGDGRIDLAVLNRGVVSVRGESMLPVVVVIADDDFDGRVDGCVLETGDADADGRADHRICVLDTNHDGRADLAVRFTDVLSDHANRALRIKDGVIEDTTAGSKISRLDFAQSWREGDALLARWNRVLAACGHP
jgi:hypothetical protein